MTDYQAMARDNLMLHFSKQQIDDLLVLERGEGPYVYDTAGRQYIDALSSLFCAQLGYSYGAEMAEVATRQLKQLPFNTNWATAHPAALELAEKVSSPGAGGRLPRLLHQRRLRVGGVGLEAGPRALHRARATAAPQGHRPQGRLPRRHPRRTVVHRHPRLQGRLRTPPI